MLKSPHGEVVGIRRGRGGIKENVVWFVVDTKPKGGW